MNTTFLFYILHTPEKIKEPTRCKKLNQPAGIPFYLAVLKKFFRSRINHTSKKIQIRTVERLKVYLFCSLDISDLVIKRLCPILNVRR